MKFLNLSRFRKHQVLGTSVMFRLTAQLLLGLLLMRPATILAQAQQFQMTNYSTGYLGQNELLAFVIVENHSLSNTISSFTISNIYSTSPPRVTLSELGWDFSVLQNPNNPVLWDLTGTNDYECSQCSQGIPTNGGTLSTIYSATFPNSAEVVFGMAPASATFAGSEGTQGSPAALLVPVGWQSISFQSPFQMNLQPTQTNGLFMLSWTGADGSIYLEHDFGLGDTNWQVLAGPVSGGTYIITNSPMANNEFFRLRLGP
jgi:hypothetical protein